MSELKVYAVIKLKNYNLKIYLFFKNDFLFSFPAFNIPFAVILGKRQVNQAWKLWLQYPWVTSCHPIVEKLCFTNVSTVGTRQLGFARPLINFVHIQLGRTVCTFIPNSLYSYRMPSEKIKLNPFAAPYIDPWEKFKKYHISTSQWCRTRRESQAENPENGHFWPKNSLFLP